MVFFNPAIEIAMIAFVLSIVSQILQKKFFNKRQMKEHQEKIKGHQKKLKELSAKTDEQSKSEFQKIETEMLELTNSMLKNSMKLSMVSLAVMLPMFWIIGGVYNGIVINLPFGIPVIHRNFSFEITSRISWLWFYIYSSVISGIILNAIITELERKGIVKNRQ